MQAGVPIVPIVIHNATDVAPKNEFVMRPATVRVTVLPPVDTSKWKVSTLNSHVRDVRNMFLRTLGQAEESIEQAVAAEAPAPKPEKAKPKKAAEKRLRPEKRRRRKSRPPARERPD
jgi:putative phosphoserine phosphatase/1-acylglycerol-3-phosphate O-acyltransferase